MKQKPISKLLDAVIFAMKKRKLYRIDIKRKIVSGFIQLHHEEGK